ncbi:hypothetical protein K6W17_10790 [Burkholderia dolosa]|nr:hypothetical protein [Burkholderia dolosa]MBY4752526.1 hypothetical protein [Burkholderia dolosa]
MLLGISRFSFFLLLGCCPAWHQPEKSEPRPLSVDTGVSFNGSRIVPLAPLGLSQLPHFSRICPVVTFSIRPPVAVGAAQFEEAEPRREVQLEYDSDPSLPRRRALHVAVNRQVAAVGLANSQRDGLQQQRVEP